MSNDPVRQYRRRQQERAARNRLILFAAVGGVALVVALVIIGRVLIGTDTRPGAIDIARVGAVGPSEEKEGQTWNHDDLVAYLTRSGVECHKHPTHMGAFFGPACFLSRDRSIDPDRFGSDGGPGVVYVQKRVTPQDAKDAAGASRGKAFFWGRFVFASQDAAYLDAVRKALGAG